MSDNAGPTDEWPDPKPDRPAKPSITDRFDRDPGSPSRRVLRQVEGRVLEPATALRVAGVDPRPTVYVGPRLAISSLCDLDDIVHKLRSVGDTLDWDVNLDETFRSVQVHGGAERQARLRARRSWAKGELGIRRLRLSVKTDRAAVAPDGWVLLQQARNVYGLEAMQGVGLDHVLNVSPFDEPAPFDHSNPFDPSGAAVSYPLSTYGRPGSGGRQPVAYVGPAPRRRSDKALSGRRPVVGILDTGCGKHPWLKGVVDRDVRLDGHRIGWTSPRTDPEVHGDLTGPLDGGLDALSGHGTFIAGLVHQSCPDADIVSWRIVNSSGPIVESEWVHALAQVAELVRRHYDGEPGGHPIDVLNLSMGYYHETPEDLLFDPTMAHLLELLGECGTVVTCSAGNDATSRPFFPAAFAPWRDGADEVPSRADCVPIVSVGATNPNRKTVALFSNTGPWVRTYASGAALLSTMPPLQGGLLPMARIKAFGHVRECIDPDDFRGQFAVWSGTSFAAPVKAGLIAEAMLTSMPAADATPSREEAVARGWTAVCKESTITPG